MKGRDHLPRPAKPRRIVQGEALTLRWAGAALGDSLRHWGLLLPLHIGAPLMILVTGLGLSHLFRLFLPIPLLLFYFLSPLSTPTGL